MSALRCRGAKTSSCRTRPIAVPSIEFSPWGERAFGFNGRSMRARAMNSVSARHQRPATQHPAAPAVARRYSQVSPRRAALTSAPAPRSMPQSQGTLAQLGVGFRTRLHGVKRSQVARWAAPAVPPTASLAKRAATGCASPTSDGSLQGPAADSVRCSVCGTGPVGARCNLSATESRKRKSPRSIARGVPVRGRCAKPDRDCANHLIDLQAEEEHGDLPIRTCDSARPTTT